MQNKIMRDLYDVFSYTKSKNDYLTRRWQIAKNLELFYADVDALSVDSKTLTNNYNCPAEIRKEKDKQTFRAIWVFPEIRVSCKSVSHSYALKVRDFNRLSDQHRNEIISMFRSKDRTFINELNRLEKRRISINAGIRFNHKILTLMKELYDNSHTLKEQVNK